MLKNKEIGVLGEIYHNIKIDRLIDESIKEIDEVIVEERTVNDEVTTMTSILCDKLKQDISNSKSLPINEEGVNFKKGITKENIFGVDITVDWRYYNIFMEKGIKYNHNSSYNINITNKTIYASITAINGKIDDKVMFEGMQHELQHLFERKKRDKPYGDERLYNFISNKMNNALTNYERAVAYVLYLFRNYEQRAFANGAYQYMIKSNDYANNFKNSLKETQLFKWYVGIKECLELFEDTDENHPLFKAAMHQYSNLNKNKLLKITKNTIEELRYLIGRILSKVIDDYKKTNEIYINPKPPTKNSVFYTNNILIEKINKKRLQNL